MNIVVMYDRVEGAARWLATQLAEYNGDGQETAKIVTSHMYPALPPETKQEYFREDSDVTFYEFTALPLPEGESIDQAVFIKSNKNLKPELPDWFVLAQDQMVVEIPDKLRHSEDGQRIAHRDASIESGFEWKGNRYQTGKPDVALISNHATRLNSLLSLGRASLSDDSYTCTSGGVRRINWRTADNLTVNFTVEGFLEFSIAVNEFVEDQFTASWV